MQVLLGSRLQPRGPPETVRTSKGPPIPRILCNDVSLGNITVERNAVARVRQNEAAGNIDCPDKGELLASGSTSGGSKSCE